MIGDNADEARERLRQAIAVQESLRGHVDEAIIEAALSALRGQLAVLEAPSRSEQRKQVTILFADTVGSTEMIRALDPEENLAVMGAALQRLTAPVAQQGGRVLRRMGDGFLAVFGVPVARESDPDRAVRASLGILAAAEAYAQELEEQRAMAGFQVRVGINTGLVAVSGAEGQEELSGTAVNLAARLESAAEPGTVLISHATYQHIRGVFDLQPQPAIRAKGFEQPLTVFRVTGEKARSFRTRRRGVEGIETTMIGRDMEMRRLQTAYQAVIETGQARALTVTADAGLGKSRLLYEFENWVDLQPEVVQLHRGRAYLETQQLPYGLLRDLFAFRWGIQDDDPAQMVRAKVEVAFAELWAADGTDEPLQAEMRAHFVGHLLGYDFQNSPHLTGVADEPGQIHDRAILYMEEYFRRAADQLPILLFLEDLHWADDSSVEALLELIRSTSGSSILYVATARPTLLERRPTWFAGIPFHERLDLSPLSQDESHRLVNDVLRLVGDLPEALGNLIVHHSEGNPFYVEELVKMLIEDGVILKDAADWQVAPERLAKVRVPPTLTGVLQARLDGLPASERTLLQQAAVVGRVFWDGVVAFLNKPPGDGIGSGFVNDGLAELRRRELVYRQDVSIFAGASEYIFKHAILRDVTYESVLLRQRRAYHARTADWLLSQRGERVGELLGLIADHLEQAGKKSEALSFLWQTGRAAADRYANEEALDYFERALVILDESGSDGLALPGDVHERSADVLNLVGRYEEALDRYASARTALEAHVLTPETNRRAADLCRKTATVYEQLSQYELAFDWLEKGAALLGESALSIEAVQIDLLRAGLLNRMGRDTEALDWCERAVRMAMQIDGLQAERAASHGYYLLGLLYEHAGEFSRSLATIEKSLRIYERVGDQVGLARAYNNLGFIYAIHGDWPKAIEAHERSQEIAGQVGSRFEQAMAANNLAEIYLHKGQLDKAERTFRFAREISHRLGAILVEAVILSNLAQVHLELRSLSEAERALDLSQSLFTKVSSNRFAPEQARRRAELHIKKGDLDTGLALAKESVHLASESGDPREVGLAQAMLGQVGLASGDLALASEALQASLASLERADLPFEMARTWLLLAKLAAKQDDLARARGYVEQAAAVFRRLGAEADLARAEGLARQLQSG